MVLDNNGYLWIATETDVIQWDVEAELISRYPYSNKTNINSFDPIIRLVVRPNETVLVLTRYGRVMTLNNNTWSTVFDPERVQVNGNDLSIQKDGTVWISLGFLGAYQYNGKTIKPIQIPETFGCGYRSIVLGNDDLWAIDGGCMKHIPSLLKYDNARWTQVGDYSPSQLITDRDGNVWFYDYDVGIVRADLSQTIKRPYGAEPYGTAIEFAPDDSLWMVVATTNFNGVYRYSNEQWEIVNNDISKCMPPLAIGNDGTVYISTGDGILSFADSKWTHHLLDN